MNPGSIASSAASSTASSAATSAASSTASNAANQAANKAASATAGQATGQAASNATAKTVPSSASSVESSGQTVKPSSKSIDDVIDTPDAKKTPDGTPDNSIDNSSISKGNTSMEDSNIKNDSFGDEVPNNEATEVEIETSKTGEKNTEKSWEEKLEEFQEELDLEAEEEEQQILEEESELQPGDRVDFGKQVGEDGQVEDTNMKKTLGAAAKAAIIIGSEGSASGAAKAIVDNPASSKLIGVVSDVAEKNPALKVTSDVLAESGVSDLVNDAADVVSDAANGDVISAAKDVVKAGKNLKKNEEKIKKKVTAIIISIASGVMACLFTFLILFGPTLGGVMWITDKLKDIYNAVTETISSALDPEWLIDEVTIQTLLDEIPGYNDLSEDRQAILSTAVLLVGTKYNMGGKPTGPGIEGVPSSGLDCSGYVEWVMWTALGTPASSGGTAFYTTDGAPYVRINKEDLLPGDIAVLREGGSNLENGDYNHVGIYAGNEMWFHAAGSSTGIVRGFSDSLSDRNSIFLRRTDIS